MGSKNNCCKIMNCSFWTLTNPNIDEVVNFIINNKILKIILY